MKLFKNYISVSFQGTIPLEDKATVVNGIMLFEIFGKTSFNLLSKRIAEKISEDKKYQATSVDVNITGISEISRRLYNRLNK